MRADEIVEENPPKVRAAPEGQVSIQIDYNDLRYAEAAAEILRRHDVDLAALNTFIVFKFRIGTMGGFNPNAEYVQQRDDYLEQSPRPLLLSLKPRYADLVFEDVKKAELRTQGILSRRQPQARVVPDGRCRS